MLLEDRFLAESGVGIIASGLQLSIRNRFCIDSLFNLIYALF
jgi:hypothetical protein